MTLPNDIYISDNAYFKAFIVALPSMLSSLNLVQYSLPELIYFELFFSISGWNSCNNRRRSIFRYCN